MSTFFDNKNNSDIGKLIHVGAGNGIELNDYVTQSFAVIHLLEPIPKVFKQLQSKINKLNKINVQCNISAFNVALSNTASTSNTEQKEQAFYITLPNRYSSLHKADKLKNLFQNLKTEQEITVKIISFSDLVKKANLDKNKQNALVLQINGSEFDVIAQAETDDLMMFSSIVIQQAKNNYFGQAKENTNLTALMESKGFQLAIEADNDVVFSNLVFRKDERALELKALNEKNEAQKACISELEAKLKASNETKTAKATESNQLTDQNKNKATRIAELENQLKASNEAKTAKSTESNQLTEQNKVKATRITELENQLKASTEAKTTETTKANQLTEQNQAKAKRVTELENQLKASNEAKAAEATKANQLTEQNQAKAKRVTELENQLEASTEAKAAEVTKVNQLTEQNQAKAKRVTELENQLKVSNEAKSTEVTKANQLTEQNQAKAKRVTELENQLKVSNEAKSTEVTKANQLTEQNQAKAKRVTELENQLKVSNEAKATEVTKANQLTEQNQAKAKRVTELENQLKVSNEAKSTEVTKANQLTEQNQAKAKRIAEVENQLKDSNEAKAAEATKANKLNEIIKARDTRIGQLKENLELKGEQETSNKLDALMEQIQQQSSEIKKNQEGLISRLNYGFNNTVKQVESFIGVQSYLETGQLAMEYHGWPISSDVALFLLGKIEKNNYDLIIEFGSGTSTQLFAKAINNHVKAQNSHIEDDLAFIGQDKRDSAELATLPLELPNRIVTFEHNKKYYNKTKSELEANKLSHLVDLVHAPLIEMKIENEDYLYYSCENKLSQLAAIYAERTARILVLIDGPPGATGPLARLPAVPLLLNYLGKHQLDIVLDDYNRQEEKETVGRWKKQFEKRDLDYEEETVPCEKGAFFCRINP
ncbi:hypothetical protein [Colwellia marinimaniae]|uniref:Chromosome partition protein Smc n=1 Tax=Colwellia marinimaniae TaxID=1513592 RepID=A0ABQ0MVS1_9GAMM|nr:hypothetical protein [Colwellia marinimaniae]GAW95726.1 hypothetical protein MTCD1_01329 [Colwellia marinimaniae]